MRLVLLLGSVEKSWKLNHASPAQVDKLDPTQAATGLFRVGLESLPKHQPSPGSEDKV